MLNQTMTTYRYSLANMSRSMFDDYLQVQSFNAEFSDKVLPVCVIFGLTACLGLIANLLVVYVYGIIYKPCNFKYCLFVLGLIGIVQCTIMLPIQVAEMHYWFMFPTSWLCRVSAYVFGYTVIDCYFVLLLIALDRFRKVCRPYKWQIQPNSAKKICVLVSAAAILFAAPPGITSGHHTFVTQYQGNNITVTVCSTDDIFSNRTWAVYFLLLFGGFPVTVVILITCVLYGVILKQFYYGPMFTLKSLHSVPNIETVNEKQIMDTNENTSVKMNENSILKSPSKNVMSNDPKLGYMSVLPDSTFHRTTLVKSIIPSNDSFRSNTSSSSGPWRSGGSKVSRPEVRRKILRKTLIVLIITVTCIMALVITFGLHTVAEDINNNVMSVPTIQLNAFVIFHRGSFSIICAIFPVLYGAMDRRFRLAIRELFGRRKLIAYNDRTV